METERGNKEELNMDSKRLLFGLRGTAFLLLRGDHKRLSLFYMVRPPKMGVRIGFRYISPLFIYIGVFPLISNIRLLLKGSIARGIKYTGSQKGPQIITLLLSSPLTMGKEALFFVVAV